MRAQFGGPVCNFKLLLVDFLLRYLILNLKQIQQLVVNCVTCCAFTYILGFLQHVSILANWGMGQSLSTWFKFLIGVCCRWMDGRDKCATASARQPHDKSRSYTLTAKNQKYARSIAPKFGCQNYARKATVHGIRRKRFQSFSWSALFAARSSRKW